MIQFLKKYKKCVFLLKEFLHIGPKHSFLSETLKLILIFDVSYI